MLYFWISWIWWYVCGRYILLAYFHAKSRRRQKPAKLAVWSQKIGLVKSLGTIP
jgi:hypothetical protein